MLRFKEKGGKEKELPVHHKLEELVDQYLKASGLEKEPGSPLFPAPLGKTGKLSRRRLVRTDAADMLKRRLKQAGLPAHYSPHSFRATGITNFLENDGILEAAQRIAGHADSRTTKLYDRRGQKVLSGRPARFRFQALRLQKQRSLRVLIQGLPIAFHRYDEHDCSKENDRPEFASDVRKTNPLQHNSSRDAEKMGDRQDLSKNLRPPWHPTKWEQVGFGFSVIWLRA